MTKNKALPEATHTATCEDIENKGLLVTFQKIVDDGTIVELTFPNNPNNPNNVEDKSFVYDQGAVNTALGELGPDAVVSWSLPKDFPQDIKFDIKQNKQLAKSDDKGHQTLTVTGDNKDIIIGLLSNIGDSAKFSTIYSDNTKFYMYYQDRDDDKSKNVTIAAYVKNNENKPNNITPEPKAEVPAPKAEVPAPKAGDPAPKAGDPAPEVGDPAPKAGGPAPEAVVPAPDPGDINSIYKKLGALSLSAANGEKTNIALTDKDERKITKYYTNYTSDSTDLALGNRSTQQNIINQYLFPKNQDKVSAGVTNTKGDKFNIVHDTPLSADETETVTDSFFEDTDDTNFIGLDKTEIKKILSDTDTAKNLQFSKFEGTDAEGTTHSIIVAHDLVNDKYYLDQVTLNKFIEQNGTAYIMFTNKEGTVNSVRVKPSEYELAYSSNPAEGKIGITVGTQDRNALIVKFGTKPVKISATDFNKKNFPGLFNEENSKAEKAQFNAILGKVSKNEKLTDLEEGLIRDIACKKLEIARHPGIGELTVVADNDSSYNFRMAKAEETQSSRENEFIARVKDDGTEIELIDNKEGDPHIIKNDDPYYQELLGVLKDPKRNLSRAATKHIITAVGGTYDSSCETVIAGARGDGGWLDMAQKSQQQGKVAEVVEEKAMDESTIEKQENVIKRTTSNELDNQDAENNREGEKGEVGPIISRQNIFEGAADDSSAKSDNKKREAYTSATTSLNEAEKNEFKTLFEHLIDQSIESTDKKKMSEYANRSPQEAANILDQLLKDKKINDYTPQATVSKITGPINTWIDNYLVDNNIKEILRTPISHLNTTFPNVNETGSSQDNKTFHASDIKKFLNFPFSKQPTPPELTTLLDLVYSSDENEQQQGIKNLKETLSTCDLSGEKQWLATYIVKYQINKNGSMDQEQIKTTIETLNTKLGLTEKSQPPALGTGPAVITAIKDNIIRSVGKEGSSSITL